jgi:putative ATP-dependent endonuclease of OLD family
VRVVVATHSLNLIDKVEISDVVHLALDQGRTTVHRLVSTDHHHTDRYLSDIAASMGLRNSALLHERCFLVVEGSTELQAIPILFRLVTGMSLQAAGVALLAGNGNWGVLKVAEFLNANDRRVHFLLDADSNTDQACRKLLQPARLRQIGIAESQLHLVGDPDEIEDLFSDAQWTQTANQCWPRNDQQPWT